MAITNHVKFTCEEKQLNEILTAIQCDKTRSKSQYGIGTIDFDKIIPVPLESSNYDTWNTERNAYDINFDNGNRISFTTSNGVPDVVICALAKMYPNVSIEYNWFGDHDFPCCGSVLYEKGNIVSKTYHRCCEISIDVPENFGFQNNKYSVMFSPEEFGVDRNDFNELAIQLLDMAIRDSATDDVSEFPEDQYEQALQIAVDCVTRCRTNQIKS